MMRSCLGLTKRPGYPALVSEALLLMHGERVIDFGAYTLLLQCLYQ
jgi:hypothetical protein